MKTKAWPWAEPTYSRGGGGGGGGGPPPPSPCSAQKLEAHAPREAHQVRQQRRRGLRVDAILLLHARAPPPPRAEANQASFCSKLVRAVRATS
jgi:hypothetical protein